MESERPLDDAPPDAANREGTLEPRESLHADRVEGDHGGGCRSREDDPRDRQIVRLERELESRNREIERLDEEIDWLGSVLADRDAEIDRLDHEVEQVTAEA